MNLHVLRAATLPAVALLALLAGCGAQPASETPAETATATPATTPETSAEAMPPPSKYDSGPRAGESPVDAVLAAQGEKLFTSKGCVACHAFGRKVTCPDLNGASMRRTAEWMEHQILHPEVMVKEDRIAWELRKGFPVPMTNMNVKPEEARALIEFIKKKDKDAGATPAS
jgi:mono/diheme cytochrome c family protein